MNMSDKKYENNEDHFIKCRASVFKLIMCEVE